MVLPIASLGIVSQRPQAHKYLCMFEELSVLKGGRAGWQLIQSQKHDSRVLLGFTEGSRASVLRHSGA